MLHSLPFIPDPTQRIIHGFSHNEDAVIVQSPPLGKALVQTVDILTPIGNNPRLFGQVAAANALSDVYAMGGEAWSAMNIVAFPAKSLDLSILSQILLGGIEKIIEAEAVLAGGHTLEEEEIKYGLSVTGSIDPRFIAKNSGLCLGDTLLLTKPLGTGVLATAIKANWGGDIKAEEAENTLFHWATALNKNAGQVIREMQLKAATDITGFGLGGHSLEMAKASNLAIEIYLENLPFMQDVLEFAEFGLIPAGSYANRQHCLYRTHKSFDSTNDTLNMFSTLVFDAQTSGGLLLAVPQCRVEEARERLNALAVPSWAIGQVVSLKNTAEQLILC